MPVHDWTSVEAGIFHAFHVAWIPELQRALNGSLLPAGYYALAEQHAGRSIADVLTLHADTEAEGSAETASGPGGTALALAPPKVSYRQTVELSLLTRRRTVAIRHVSGHQLVALIEILSPANKDRPRTVAEFVDKAAEAIEAGVHLLLVDLFPPGPHDPQGINRLICESIGRPREPFSLPAGAPLTLASYAADSLTEVYLEHLAPGDTLPEMPLFLDPQHYVNVPLEPTYAAAWQGMPSFWRDVLEKHTPKA